MTRDNSTQLLDPKVNGHRSEKFIFKQILSADTLNGERPEPIGFLLSLHRQSPFPRINDLNFPRLNVKVFVQRNVYAESVCNRFQNKNL